MPEKFQQFAALKPEGEKETKTASPETPKSQFDSTERRSIEETDNFVSYLGVKLEKAQNRESVFVPDKAKYDQFYINDAYSLRLQQKFAVAFKDGWPIMVEGGSSIGKTTTVRKMCADLGYEAHYINLNGNIDAEDMMGKYIPNVQKKPDQPEFAFADGAITSGLRQEDGKIKVIMLDEVNTTNPAILKRLNEVLDAVERSGQVILTEDASEVVEVNKATTKVVALMNPAGQGYLGVNPLSKELIRRWVYQKEAGELPRESFSYRQKARRGKAPKTEANIPGQIFLNPSDELLSVEEYNAIPGIDEIEALYEEFHYAAKEMLKARNIAADQPQELIFDDAEESERVFNFVRRYFNGDIAETFQQALRFFYSNKLESEEKKQMLEEKIRHIIYAPKTESKRKGTGKDKQAKKEKLADREKSGEFADFDYLQFWLRDNDLERYLEGGSLEALIGKQEEFYRQSYGADFNFDRSAIKIESSRLELIQKGLENGSINYPLLTAIPDKLTSAEAKMTQVEFAYHKLLKPLKDKDLKIWAEIGPDRWTKLTLTEILRGYIPVELKDFNAKDLEDNWQKEISRVIAEKKAAPKIKANQVELTFTDSRQNVPREQRVINQNGEESDNKFSFKEMVKNQVRVLTPEQWMVLAAQKYEQDKTYLSRNTWDWMMAILKNKDGVNPPVSAANAVSDADGVDLNSNDAADSGGFRRWRSAL